MKTLLAVFVVGAVLAGLGCGENKPPLQPDNDMTAPAGDAGPEPAAPASSSSPH